MEKQIFQVYDGKVLKQIECSEILTSTGKPTGQYEKKSERQISVYGTFLDIEENRELLKVHIDELAQGYQTSGLMSKDLNYFITDKQGYCELITDTRKWSSENKETFKTVYDVLIKIILSLGYVNEPYIINDTQKPFHIEFTITPKNDERPSFKLYLIPMDEYCYVLGG